MGHLLGSKGGSLFPLKLITNRIRANHRPSEWTQEAQSILLPPYLIKDMKWILMWCWTAVSRLCCSSDGNEKINPSYKETKQTGRDAVPWELWMVLPGNTRTVLASHLSHSNHMIITNYFISYAQMLRFDFLQAAQSMLEKWMAQVQPADNSLGMVVFYIAGWHSQHVCMCL